VDRYDLSSLELVMCGSAPLSAELEAECAARLGRPVLQVYGLTETGPVVSISRRHGPRTAGSAGTVVPGTQVRLVDPVGGADLAAGQTGELWVRGPQVMAGYLANPKATAATIDADGWLRTGDLGTVTADGEVFVADRIKELIKVSGFQVAPAELEALLVTHPAVADVAVVGRPDERAGERPVAFVVARGELDPDELIAWAAQRTAGYKRLAAVTVVDSVPRSPAGKLLRRELRGSAQTALPVSTSPAGQVNEATRPAHGPRRVSSAVAPPQRPEPYEPATTQEQRHGEGSEPREQRPGIQHQP
jgi:acyl-CoA synthetase (AMP-forming)/AMP-acid ligase II